MQPHDPQDPVAHPNGHPHHDHERTDVPVRLLGKFLLGMGITGVLIVVGLGLFWRYLGSRLAPHPAGTTFAGARELPPGPRLQVAPRLDLQTYQQQEQQRLNTYGWSDRDAGVAHIPIGRAMELTLQRGLPARPRPPEPKSSAPETLATPPPAQPEPGARPDPTAQRSQSPHAQHKH
ncbi:MAG: hypothetical protein HYS04_18780 [Acidobacteria bacterium]|nr:hypothetical protein [Acidobacteriota bacterium]